MVSNCTFWGNSATFGGGIHNSSSNPTVTNCIFRDDTASTSGNEFYDTSSTPTVTYSIVEGGYLGTGNIDSDPLFTDAASGELTLQSTSPAIDAANGNVALTTDLEGNSRIDIAGVDNTGVGPAADIGAYEYQGD